MRHISLPFLIIPVLLISGCGAQQEQPEEIVEDDSRYSDEELLAIKSEVEQAVSEASPYTEAAFYDYVYVSEIDSKLHIDVALNYSGGYTAIQELKIVNDAVATVINEDDAPFSVSAATYSNDMEWHAVWTTNDFSTGTLMYQIGEKDFMDTDCTLDDYLYLDTYKFKN